MSAVCLSPSLVKYWVQAPNELTKDPLADAKSVRLVGPNDCLPAGYLVRLEAEGEVDC